MKPPPLVAMAWAVVAMLVLVILLGGYGYFSESLRDDVLRKQTEELLAITRMNGMKIESNAVALSNLLTKSTARPLKFDACDGAAVVGAMRQGGLRIEAQDFEARCKADNASQQKQQ